MVSLLVDMTQEIAAVKRIVYGASDERFHRRFDDSQRRFQLVGNIGDEFLIYNRFFLSAERYPFFILKSNEELTSVNFKTILHRECNVSFTEMSYGMQVIKFPDSISRVLKLAKEAVGLMLEILASSERVPVYFQEIYVPQTSFKLCITDSATLPKSMS